MTVRSHIIYISASVLSAVRLPQLIADPAGNQRVLDLHIIINSGSASRYCTMNKTY